MDIGSQDFSSPEELWKTIDASKEKEWYGAAVEYWDKQEASYDGVLGGFGFVSEADIEESGKFLCKVFSAQLKEAGAGTRRLVAADCGAGVGRVSEQLLLHHFQEVDLVEPSRHLLDTAEQRMSGSQASTSFPAEHKLGKTFCMGLQQFAPEEARYDVIWIQWALLYLTDDDAIAFFQRCRGGLKPGGVIVVKENICSAEAKFVVDKEDRSLTRSHPYMLRLFDEAGMQLVSYAQQKNFPRELFKVHMYAVRPKG